MRIWRRERSSRLGILKKRDKGQRRDGVLASRKERRKGGRRAVERRSEDSGVEKDEVQGLNQCERERDRCEGQRLQEGTAALLLLQIQPQKLIRIITFRRRSLWMSRHQPGEMSDSTHVSSPSARSAPCLHVSVTSLCSQMKI